MTQERRHAAVLGASMGGLLAARVLAEFYDRVTVLERDPLPSGTTGRQRRGVPQGRHLHTLLPRGAAVLDDLFPGLVGELVGAGATPTTLLNDVRLLLSGYQFARTDTGDTGIQLTRPMLEQAVRGRLAGLSRVRIVDECDVLDLRTEGGAVTGVRVRRHAAAAEDTLDTDLVVDAMGRAGRTRAWLTRLGHPVPTEDRIKTDMAYVSRYVTMPPGALEPDKLVLIGPVPGRPRGLGMAQQEGGRWVLTVVGMAGDHPPTDDEAAYWAFVRSCTPAEVYAAVRAAEPLSGFVTHRFPASIRRRYERLAGFPPGLLVFGDAICSFNPIYGQGMTVAALEAEALRRCLATDPGEPAPRFFAAAARIIEPAWQLSAGGDLALPEIEGDRPLATRLVNRYVARLHRVARYDTVLAHRFVRVIGLLEPPAALFAPRILARVLIGGRRGARRRVRMLG